MAKAERVSLHGKLKWCRLNTPDEYGKWSVKLYPNPESLDKINKLKSKDGDIDGIKNKLSKDDDGYCVSFSRKTVIKTNGGRGEVALTAPEVLDKDGAPYIGPIGNGSDGTVDVEVYQHKKGFGETGIARAARLMAVRVDNLVPFNKGSDFTDNQQRQIRGIANVPPEPLF